LVTDQGIKLHIHASYFKFCIDRRS
jgi:hypothetical protein